MKYEIQTIEEAIIFATKERISYAINGRSWIGIVDEWSATKDAELESQLHAVNSEMVREIKKFLGDWKVENDELPLH